MRLDLHFGRVPRLPGRQLLLEPAPFLHRIRLAGERPQARLLVRLLEMLLAPHRSLLVQLLAVIGKGEGLLLVLVLDRLLQLSRVEVDRNDVRVGLVVVCSGFGGG